MANKFDKNFYDIFVCRGTNNCHKNIDGSIVVDAQYLLDSSKQVGESGKVANKFDKNFYDMIVCRGTNNCPKNIDGSRALGAQYHAGLL